MLCEEIYTGPGKKIMKNNLLFLILFLKPLLIIFIDRHKYNVTILIN